MRIHDGVPPETLHAQADAYLDSQSAAPPRNASSWVPVPRNWKWCRSYHASGRQEISTAQSNRHGHGSGYRRESAAAASPRHGNHPGRPRCSDLRATASRGKGSQRSTEELLGDLALWKLSGTQPLAVRSFLLVAIPSSLPRPFWQRLRHDGQQSSAADRKRPCQAGP